MSELRENCGLFAVYDDPEAASLVPLGLFALQHRGEESAGIVWSHEGVLSAHRGLGLVTEALPPARMSQVVAKIAVGHTRYATAGGSGLHNAQPFLASTAKGQVAVAHNGTLTNARKLRRELESGGAIFSSNSDTEVILHLVARAQAVSFVDRLKEALPQIEGAFSLVLLSGTTLVALRDPMGFRPLVLGERNGKYVVASETCALDLIEARVVREIEPGEMVIIDERGLRSERYASKLKVLPGETPRVAPCVFEHIYFARPDSNVFGRDVYLVRKALGRELGRLHPAEADIVIPVPDSGVPAAIGFSEQTKIPFDMIFTRSHYVGRSFIQPAQNIRNLSVRLKLAAASNVLKGKRVVVVDDSLVRGTTSKKIVALLRHAGAQQVHLRISAPPTISPCYYGIDMPTKAELIAANQDIAAIRDFIGADSVGYLDLPAMRRAVGYDNASQFCEACFSGQYPVPVADSQL
ncbi:MAG: amidophosphoribosyltransferase [Deltaproteobacteria bacterium]|nr:amidophosphoribosyltransferase [Deltaproteobacteria bacterium]